MLRWFSTALSNHICAWKRAVHILEPKSAMIFLPFLNTRRIESVFAQNCLQTARSLKQAGWFKIGTNFGTPNYKIFYLTSMSKRLLNLTHIPYHLWNHNIQNCKSFFCPYKRGSNPLWSQETIFWVYLEWSSFNSCS